VVFRHRYLNAVGKKHIGVSSIYPQDYQMDDEFRKLELGFQTNKKMIISLAKNLDKHEVDVASIKKAVEGFDGRMLIMAVRIVELQERIERIDESLQHLISIILESGCGIAISETMGKAAHSK
jgi:hypothetical protein